MEQFGGHKYAAGMTLPIENIEAFQQKFEEVVSASISEDLLTPEIEIDAELEVDQITDQALENQEAVLPFIKMGSIYLGK